jgi:hypothetical protein
MRKVSIHSFLFSFYLIGLLSSCREQNRTSHIDYEPLWRKSDETELAPFFEIKKSPLVEETSSKLHLAPITKEYFRCKGNSMHPPRIILEEGKEVMRFYDCHGSEKHSLPLYDGKERIFPVLIELLNEIQKQTGKPVIITSGHRCPVHQLYMDSKPKAQSSKHTIGAEASFYVQGLHEHPEKILAIIFSYYKNHPEYKTEQEYTQFQRYQKETDVATSPWYNKEILIKLYQPNEGRNFDNKHPYPYLSIQVRFDRDKKERVLFTQDQAQNYLRK